MGDALAHEPPVEFGDVRDGRLPARYGYRMQDPFLDQVLGRLRAGAAVLDVGGGRNPAVPVELRPPGVRYVGLDASAQELASAPPGGYDDILVHDVTRPLPEGQAFDMIVSWQVLEHVAPLATTLENMRAVLRPGGTLIAQLSGALAIFAVAAKVMPHRLRVAAMERLGHPTEGKFPTQYDRCWASALEGLLASWSEHELVTYYRGAAYLSALRPLQRAYLRYENVVYRREVRNLATHYLIIAVR